MSVCLKNVWCSQNADGRKDHPAIASWFPYTEKLNSQTFAELVRPDLLNLLSLESGGSNFFCFQFDPVSELMHACT